MNGGVLCVIPARGGSKRLPRKNVLDFRGKPMLQYSVEAALQSGCFARVAVSSEDEEILAIARAAGAEPTVRPAALATDQARVSPVLLDLLDSEAREGRDYDIVCCLYPAAPMRQAADIRAVLALIEPGRADFALAVTDYDLPPHQALKLGAGNDLVPMFPDLVNKRDEEIGHLVVDNGSTYAATVAAFREHKTFYGPGLRGHVMPRARSVDINLPEDLDLADYYYGRLLA
jgi:CMP-N-acetylneuraminic acid synthetase